MSSFTLLLIAFLGLASCAKKESGNQVVEEGKKAFLELYKMEADTCIQLESTYLFFTRTVKSAQRGDVDSTYVYLFSFDHNKWSPLLSKGFMRLYSSPVTSPGVVDLEGRKYLYLEHDWGGGSMGNNLSDFILYDLQETTNEYTLSFEYYPPEVTASSSIKWSKNLNRESPLYTFLYEKAQSNELFQGTGGLAKMEDTPPLSGWKCDGLLGRVKSVKYENGDCIDFNADGNIIKITDVWTLEGGEKKTDIKTYAYQSPTDYTITGGFWGHATKHKIHYEKNVRKDIQQDGEPFDSKFVFDKQGRLVREEPNVEFDAKVVEYKYKNETDLFPYQEIDDSSYEGDGGSYYIVSTFEYLKIDTKGNWLERKVSRKVSAEDEMGEKSNSTSTFTEKRNITYF